MKCQILIFTLFINLFIYGQNKSFTYWENRILSNVSYGKVKQSVIKENFTYFNSKRDIPKPLIDFLKKYRSRVDFANPNQEYNSTDNRDDGLPDRQIILILKNKNHILLTYKHGGIGFHHHILWAEIKKNTIVDIWICSTFKSLNSKNEILKVLSQNSRELNTNMVCF